MAQGRCTNIAKECPNALNKEILDADPANFICPLCGKPLVKVQGKEPVKGPGKGSNDQRPRKPWIIIGCLVVAIALCVWGAMNLKGCGHPDTVGVDTVDTVGPGPVGPGPDSLEHEGPGPDGPGPDGPETGPKSVFGGAATLSADGSVITFKRSYNLDLHTMDGETLSVSPGDKIRGAKIVNGRLVSGEYVSTSNEERYLSGLNNKL